MKIIEKIDGKFTRNNIFLEQAKFGSANKDSTSFTTTYVKCGAPFFKDALGTPAPLNDDYKFRKNIQQEFFPFDLPQTSSRWRTKEKVALINGVKDQIVNHIKSQQSKKLCEGTRKTRKRMQTLKFISHNPDLQQSSMIDLYETIQKNYPDFTINWNIISFSNLQSNHSVSECMGMWFSYLRPDINREPFSDQENTIIANSLTDNDFNSWNEIADQLDRRSSLQAFVHFHASCARLYPSHIRWSEDEDAKLLKLIEKNSINNVINWSKIGQILPTRSKTQCYNRYQILVKNSSLKKGTFTRKENRIILDYVDKHGENALKKIPKILLPGRSLVQIRVHYNNVLKQKGTVHPWTHKEDEILFDFVSKKGTNNWRGIADTLQTHNRLSCRTRYNTIVKFLSQNKDKKLKDVPTRHKTKTSLHKANEESLSDEEVIEDHESKNRQPSSHPVNSVEKFKQRNPEMFKLMRTTYNFDLSVREICADNTRLKVLMQLLNSNEKQLTTRRPYLFTKSQLLKFHEVENFKLNESLLKEVKLVSSHVQFLMPPNYNTSVGLRALEIKMREEPIDESSIIDIPYPRPTYLRALEDFQQLFFSLFYWSAMLKKVDKNELNEIHFMKHRNRGLSAKDIFKQLNKRQLHVTSGFNLETRLGTEKYPPSKKHRK